MKPNETTWYLYAENAHSNEVVSQTLDGLQTINEFKKHVCADGKQRHLYKVPDHAFASRMHKSQTTLCAKFKIFRSQNDGAPTEVDFDALARKKRKPTLSSLEEKSGAIKLGAMMPQHRKR